MNQTLGVSEPHEATITGVSLGTNYKVEISSVNLIGESVKSPALVTKFANVPSVPLTFVLTSTTKEIKATWAAPTTINGDAVQGYYIYMDDGQGSGLKMIKNTVGVPSTLSTTITQDYTFTILACGRTYRLQITAVNLAGESLPASGTIILGESPNQPTSLSWVQVVPDTKIILSWTPPTSNGGLPIRSYVISKDGADLANVILPSAK